MRRAAPVCDLILLLSQLIPWHPHAIPMPSSCHPYAIPMPFLWPGRLGAQILGVAPALHSAARYGPGSPSRRSGCRYSPARHCPPPPSLDAAAPNQPPVQHVLHLTAESSTAGIDVKLPSICTSSGRPHAQIACPRPPPTMTTSPLQSQHGTRSICPEPATPAQAHRTRRTEEHRGGQGGDTRREEGQGQGVAASTMNHTMYSSNVRGRSIKYFPSNSRICDSDLLRGATRSSGEGSSRGCRSQEAASMAGWQWQPSEVVECMHITRAHDYA